MTIIHFSDTHLGFNDLEIVNESGINQREADFYNAFTQVIDAILETKPDYVIHTGDLFHRPHPSNRAISFCLTQLKRLSVAQIPLIIIAGNHSTPRTRSASPILAALRTLDHIYPVFEERYEKVIFDNINFHCIPHINDEISNLAAIEQCEASVDEDKHNIMMLHCSVGAQFMMEEYGERVYPREKEPLFEQMDYVALGHWHGFGSVGKHCNVYYAGSTERTSSGDARNDKGYALITLGETLDIAFHPITLRPSHRLHVDAQTSEDIYDELRLIASSLETEGALLTITIENLSATQSIDIANRDIEACFPTALNVQIQRKFRRTESSAATESVNAASLQEYFGAFLEEQTSTTEEFTRLSSKVATLFARYDEVNNDA
ncbi:MAG TPA: exonuclease SbcCD subunit D [Sulfuricurvum sp.]|jgi:DNA repair exonuclease SbcCD nuclease subunit|nr:MAG: exonuclease sbcCD subunit D [Campylobacterales bacterium 16-40-21]OZA02105.1 MAG: exonuclease sbcCD subunit D [Sulfuricurvum sp. 17-40-25]HQS67756.1 exonuclease SbcCD subunit D [Sulfuricurvum sp.]HQT37187.1 exonuclease SbcCD subunit D [Sulfuricurvum sp.]